MKERLKQLGIRLSVLTDDSKCALWLSGGADSTLLLEMLIRLNLRFSVLTFDTAWNKDQKKRIDALVEKHSLIVYSYPPKSMILIGNGSDISFAANYAVGKRGEIVSVISDFVEGKRCAFDVKIPLSEKALAPVRFDTHIWGSKKSDKHYAGDAVKSETWNVGGSSITAPLFAWTDEDVHAALNYLKADYVEPSEEANTGNLPVCFNCLKKTEKAFCPKENKEIDAVKWNPAENLEMWRRLC